MRLTLVSVELFDAAGRPTGLGPLVSPKDSAKIVSRAIQGVLAAGTYRVRWRAAGADGHPASGEFPFELLPEAIGGPAPTSAAAPQPPRSDSAISSTSSATSQSQVFDGFAVGSPLYVVVRWMALTSCVLLIGAVFFRLLVLGALEREGTYLSLATQAATRLRAIGIAAAFGVMVFTALRLLMQMWTMQAAAPVGVSIGSDIALDGLWGTGWWLELVGAAAALGALAIPALSQFGWKIALLACVGAITVGQAMGGHAAAATNLNTAIALDALHLLAAGAWIGGIAAIAAAALPSLTAIQSDLRGPGAVLLLRLFSPLALSGASVLLLSGAYEAYLRLGTFAALVQSSYGRALLIKVALVAATAGLGALNWRRLSLRASDAAGVRTLQQSVRLELTVAALVLLVTAVLIALPTPVE